MRSTSVNLFRSVWQSVISTAHDVCTTLVPCLRSCPSPDAPRAADADRLLPSVRSPSLSLSSALPSVASSQLKVPTSQEKSDRPSAVSPPPPYGAQINTRPIVQFNALYMAMYSATARDQRIAAADALLIFLSNPANVMVMKDNAQYQIPPTPGDPEQELEPATRAACFAIRQWRDAGADPKSWQWTCMWEWLNNVHYLCPDPLEGLFFWLAFTSATNPQVPELQIYLGRFFANPYTMTILQNAAQARPTHVAPYPHAQFAIDWSTASALCGTWLHANALAQIVFTHGPARDGVVEGLQTLIAWCVPTAPPATSKNLDLSTLLARAHC